MDSSFPFHGDLKAPDGLLPLTQQLASCPWPIRVERSGFDGTLYLKARHHDVELETDSGQQHTFHFSGAVYGTRDHALQRIAEFSACLKRAGIVHCVELYEQPPPAGGAIVAQFTYDGCPPLHMRDTSSFRPALPVGWFYPDPEVARSLHHELQQELPPGHLLAGRVVETFAWREHATDDVIFRHLHEPDRFTVIHLSWLGRTEINPLHPTVEFDGTFEGFLADEEARHGLKPPRDA